MIRFGIALAMVVGCSKSSSKQEPPAAAKSPVCVDGKQVDCEQNGKGKWTGAKCCVDAPVTCVDGQQLDCEQNGKGKWTGAQCCIPGAVTCTEGKQLDCEQNGKGKWTGAKCCL